MAKTTPRFNKSTGLFGMGGGKRKGAKSKMRQFLDDLKGSKNKKIIKSSKKANKSRVKTMKKQLKQELKDQGMKGRFARQTAKVTAPIIVQKQKEETLANKIKAKEVAKQEMLQRQKEVTKQKAESQKNTTPTPSQGQSNARSIQKENERIRQNQQARRDASAEGSAYKITMRDGSIKNVLARKPGESDADFKKRFTEMHEASKKTKSAKHGGALAIMIAPVKSKKMKAVKKAPGGGAMKKMQTYKKGGALKAVPSDAKGLSKLPTSVRNKMGYMKNGGKVTGPDKKKKSVVTVDQDLKDLGNALKEGVKMITIPGYGAMKLAEYLRKRKQGMSKADIVKTKSDGAEAKQEMAKMGNMKRMVEKPTMKRMVEKPTMKRTMTKLVKKKDKKISLPKKTVSKIDPPKEIKLKGRKMMYGGSMKKAMYGAKMKKKAMYGAKMKKKAMYGAKMKK
tara:strand:- start:5116 stop:6468 length:1353 start_codon:yes stop_codon:yes gene_type:complete